MAYLNGKVTPPTSVVMDLCTSVCCSPSDLLRPVAEPDPAVIIAEATKRPRKASGLGEKVTDPVVQAEAAALLKGA